MRFLEQVLTFVLSLIHIFSSFITRFVRELVGAGAEQKVAEMGAKVHDAFFETLGIRLGRSRKELEQEYGVKRCV